MVDGEAYVDGQSRHGLRATAERSGTERNGMEGGPEKKEKVPVKGLGKALHECG